MKIGTNALIFNEWAEGLSPEEFVAAYTTKEDDQGIQEDIETAVENCLSNSMMVCQKGDDQALINHLTEYFQTLENKPQDLTTKAMLVRLSISQWSAKRLDKKITLEVARTHGCKEDVGAFNKALVAKEDLAGMQKLTNEARNYHYAHTLPWLDDGCRILPAACFLDYAAEIRGFKVRFALLVTEFVEAYPRLVAHAQTVLNGMFNPADYPSAEGIERKFSFSVTEFPLPSAGDFRVEIGAEAREKIKRNIEEHMAQAAEACSRDLWKRLHGAVEAMASKLANENGIFRDSLVGNIVELVHLLPKLNLTDDPELEKARLDMEQKLCAWGPQALRDDAAARRVVAREATAMLNRMSAYTGG